MVFYQEDCQRVTQPIIFPRVSVPPPLLLSYGLLTPLSTNKSSWRGIDDFGFRNGNIEAIHPSSQGHIYTVLQPLALVLLATIKLSHHTSTPVMADKDF